MRLCGPGFSATIPIITSNSSKHMAALEMRQGGSDAATRGGFMERLSCSDTVSYQSIEAAIHISRYAGALGLCAGRRVLDVACGEGYGSFLMAEAGAAEVVGVDVSAEAIASAAAQFRHPRLRYREGDAERLDEWLQEDPFDLIVSLETVEHLRDPVRFLECLRHLRAKDGVVLMSCPNDHWYYRADESNPFHIRKYTFAEFKNLAEQVLGLADSWHLGTAAAGFVTIPLEDTRIGRSGRDYTHVRRIGASFLCPASSTDAPGVEQSSYFLGAWGVGALDEGAAVFPMTMDRYAIHMRSEILEQSLARESQRAEQEQARLEQALAGERQRAEQEQARLEQVLVGERQRAEQEQRLARVQLNALRKEADILAASVRRLKEQEASGVDELRRFNVDLSGLTVERDALLAERERLFERLRPIWAVAQLVPRPVRRGLRGLVAQASRLLAS